MNVMSYNANHVDRSFSRKDNTTRTIDAYNSQMDTYLNQMHQDSLSDDFRNLTSLADKLQHIKNETTNQYMQALMSPETCMNAKIPSTVPFPSSSFKLHTTYTGTTNTSGNFAAVFNPWFLDPLFLNSSFAFNNNNTLTGTAFNNNFLSVPIGQQIPDLYIEYRLVSTSVIITSKASNLNNSGVFGGAIMPDPSTYVQLAGVNMGGGQYGNFSLIDDAYYSQVCSAQDGMRLLYFPLDPSYETYIPISTQKQGLIFCMYGQSLPPSSPCVRFDFYMNFEAFPNLANASFIPKSLPEYADSKTKNEAIIEVQKKPISKNDKVIEKIDPRPKDNGGFFDTLLSGIGKAANTISSILDFSEKTTKRFTNPLSFVEFGKDLYDKSGLSRDSFPIMNKSGFSTPINKLF